MARPRVCRHDVRYSESGSTCIPKDGTSKGRQVYHCGDCGRRTIPDAAYQRPGTTDKERALAMYQEGGSLSAVARIFRVSVQAVSQWVKRGPADRSRMRRRGEKRTAGVVGVQPAAVIAFDEMCLPADAAAQTAGCVSVDGGGRAGEPQPVG